MSSVAEAANAPRESAKGGKFLSFFLAGEEYGLEILKVHEIISMLPITRVPRTPPFVRGVVNLRGKVIPIMDLRLKFGMDAGGAESCIIVVQLRGVQIGIVVDRVSEVLNISASDIEPPPSFGADVQTEYLLGLAKGQDRVRLLLDIERALSSSEVEVLRITAGETPAAESPAAAA